jgi:hypothetical protein
MIMSKLEGVGKDVHTICYKVLLERLGTNSMLQSQVQNQPHSQHPTIRHYPEPIPSSSNYHNLDLLKLFPTIYT